MIQETTVRKGFLTDEGYTKLLNELPQELKALFVCGYITGMRKGELTVIQWPQVDFEGGIITLDMGETKNDEARSVPILEGEMRELLLAAKKDRDAYWPRSPWVFHRCGDRIKDFRWSWNEACRTRRNSRREIPRLASDGSSEHAPCGCSPSGSE